LNQLLLQIYYVD